MLRFGCYAWIMSVGSVPLPAAQTYDLADLKALEHAFVKLAEEVRPSVVAIRTYQSRTSGNPEGRLVSVPYSQGSGFVIDSDGFIATNRHVIQDADLVAVILDNGMRYEAVIQQADRRSDLAVLKIDAEGLKAVRWGELNRIRVNQWAFACGNPFGRANQDGKPSISFGVISALGRMMTQRLVGDSETEYYGNLLETSASINPGNSGGPLFNIDGEVIGVVTAIETGAGGTEGRGFAIPIDRNTRRILATLKAGLPVKYGFLGVNVKENERFETGLAVQTGVRGAEIEAIRVSDGPAAKAGLRPRDVVIEFDGVPVENSDHLVRLVGFTPVGTEASIIYLRGGVKRRTVVVVGDRQEMIGDRE